MCPKKSAVAFEAEIASAEQGLTKRGGGATQVLVPDRTQFNEPEYLSSIDVRKK